jgi:hypothetical protein
MQEKETTLIHLSGPIMEEAWHSEQAALQGEQGRPEHQEALEPLGQATQAFR